ncbi:GDSL-type esterase/lipase family protein [Cellulomonas pakistanensis]|nr:GDSL-type esterase/lipase family protein [Cellulomonas pakistanensis]
MTVTFPESGARVSGGDVAFRGLVSDRRTTTPDEQETRIQYVVDVSGSTASPLQDCNGDGVRDALDDFNGDGRHGDVLDCEISAVVALNAGLRGVPGSATHLRVGLTAFGTSAAAAQMDKEDESARFIPPGQTGEGKDVIPDLNVVASSLRQGLLGQYARKVVGESTNFDAALTTALSTLEQHAGPRWIFFLSDGQASVSQATLNRVDASGVNVRTFAVGNDVGSAPCAANAPLGRIAAAGGDSCIRVVDPSDLTASVVDSQPQWLDSVMVDVDGRTAQADIDPVGGWSATVPGLPTGSHTAVVTATLSDGRTLTTAVPFRVATHISYTALGDSYASGEGVSPYLYGSQEDQLCHRSRAGWPTLVSVGGDPAPLSLRDDAVFRFVACSGARIVNLDTTPQDKKVGFLWLKDEYDIPLQLDQLNPDADLVTLSIGGNDLGFAPVVTHCITRFACQSQAFIDIPSGPVTLDDWMTIRLALVGNELTGAYQAVRDRVSDDTRIVATTYPRLVSGGPEAFGNLLCWPPVLSHAERQWIRDRVDTFAAIVTDRARRPGAGLQVVDVRDDFEDRNVCDGDAHLLGPTVLRLDDLEFSPISAASFHPTERGARLYAAAVNDALRHTFVDEAIPGQPGRSADAAQAAHDVTPTRAVMARPATSAAVLPAALDPSDAAIVTDPDSVLAEYPPDVVDAVGSTTFADVFLGNGAAIDGHPACDDVVESEIVPLLAHGLAPGSEVTAETATMGADGTELGRTSTTHRVDDDGTLRSTFVAPAVGAEGLLTVSVRGIGAGGGPAVGTALATTSVDAGCRAKVADAGRLAPPETGTRPSPGGVDPDPGGAASAGTAETAPDAASASPGAPLSSTGATIAWAAAAAVLLLVGGATTRVLVRWRSGSAPETGA